MPRIPALSIIVPIYNVQRYLRQCLDSLVGQTMQDIEFILIDDGSPDECGRIIDEYAAEDSRVVAVHQENSGYGRTLNNGIRRARGYYIGIIESDDWIELDMFEKLYRAAREHDADIAKCGFSIYNSLEVEGRKDSVWQEVHEMFETCPDGIFSPRDYKKIFMYHSALWTCIYRRDLVLSVPLNETSRSYQDYPFVFEILAKAESMVMVKELLHHYRMEQGQGSSSMTRSVRSMQMMDMTEFALKRLRQNDLLRGIEKEFFQHSVLANQYFYHQTPEEHQATYARRLKDFLQNNTDAEVFSDLDKSTKRWLFEIGVLKNFSSLSRIMRFFIHEKH